MEKLDLEKFNPTREELTKLVTESKGLVIKGVDDKKGYILVHEARIKLRDARIQIAKTGKSLRDDALKFQRAVITKEKEYIALIEPTEIELSNKQNTIDEEKEKIKRIELLPDRKEKLKAINAELSDEKILAMDSIEFQTTLNILHTEFLAEKERVAEEKRLKEEEKIRKEREKIVEEKRQLDEQKRIDEAKKQAEKESTENAIKDAELAKLRAEEDKQRAIEEERKKAEEEIKHIIKKQEEKEKARLEAEQKKLRKEKETEEQAQAEKIALEKKKKYQDFLANNGYSKDTKNEFHIFDNGNIIILYKKIAEYKK